VVADGDLDGAELAALARPSRGAAAGRPYIIAADGGAARCLGAGVRPDVVVGDLDSLGPVEQARLRELGVELRVADRDKDESDTELCLLTARAAGASRVTVLGALGVVRPEHAIANLLLLADPRLDEMEVAVVGRGSRIMRTGTAEGASRLELGGTAGDLVSLFPLGSAVEGVTTEGLRFPLHDETLTLGPSRGLSNEMLAEQAQVRTRRGRLLVVHTRVSAEAEAREEPR